MTSTAHMEKDEEDEESEEEDIPPPPPFTQRALENRLAMLEEQRKAEQRAEQ